MPHITIRFVTANDPVSIAIRMETWGKFSHVEFILDDGTTLGAHADGGVAIRPLNYAKFTEQHWYSIPVTEEQKIAIMAFAHEQVGKPYDFTDIAGILFHRDWRSDDSWICSELVAAAFEKGLPLLHIPDKDVNRVTPGGLYQTPYLIDNEVAPMIVD